MSLHFSSLEFDVKCGSCQEGDVTEDGVEAFVPIKDTQSGEHFRLEFEASAREGQKTVVPLAFRNHEGTDVLPDLDDASRDRLRTLLKKLNDSGICGSLAVCPTAIKNL